MSAGQVVLAVLFAAACIYTVVGYPHRYGALTGRSRLFRTVGITLLVLFLGLVLLYTFLDFQASVPSRRIAALRQITYLAACFFLALTLLCLALLDWLEALVFYRREQRSLLHQMAREEMERARHSGRRWAARTISACCGGRSRWPAAAAPIPTRWSERWWSTSAARSSGKVSTRAKASPMPKRSRLRLPAPLLRGAERFT
jgi:hypothetical protein